MNGVAFFDIEGTLIRGTLSGPFLRAGRALRVFKMPAVLRAFSYSVAGTLGPRSRAVQLRWKALLTLLGGLPVADIRRVGEAAVADLQRRLKPEVVEAIRAHLTQGDTVVLISGGLDDAARMLAAAVGATRGEGTRVVKDAGRYWGLLATPICRGEAKLRRAAEIARELGVDLAACTFYGDSADDIPLLAHVGVPVVVDPDRRLAREARARGWGILTAGA